MFVRQSGSRPSRYYKSRKGQVIQRKPIIYQQKSHTVESVKSDIDHLQAMFNIPSPSPAFTWEDQNYVSRYSFNIEQQTNPYIDFDVTGSTITYQSEVTTHNFNTSTAICIYCSYTRDFEFTLFGSNPGDTDYHRIHTETFNLNQQVIMLSPTSISWSAYYGSELFNTERVYTQYRLRWNTDNISPSDNIYIMFVSDQSKPTIL